jgi:hypothetical protein
MSSDATNENGRLAPYAIHSLKWLFFESVRGRTTEVDIRPLLEHARRRPYQPAGLSADEPSHVNDNRIAAKLFAGSRGRRLRPDESNPCQSHSESP